MRNAWWLLFCVALIASPALAQIFLDGSDSDWLAEPLLIESVDNVDGFFPSEVGAAVTDNVDIKEVKAKIVGNVCYFFMRVYGGPAWPNKADQRELNGVPINRSRGYYDLLMDLDNDVTTGANSHYYEAHFTPVGYLASQGIANQDKIGADSYLEWGCVGYFTPPHTENGGVANSGIKEIGNSAYDVTEVVSETDAGADYTIFESGIAKPDSAKAFAWSGTLAIEGSDDAHLINGKSYWMGHAWGNDFLEMGIELTMIQDYWKNKGRHVLNPGDVIGIAFRTETPMDDWGVDLTPRGQMLCPEIPVRPSSITFDGDDSDWAAMPVLVQSVDNVDGFFPSEVGAAVTDNVDVKEVKAFVNLSEDAIYWFMRLWGGPAWPNVADQRELNGVPINRSRGYYDLLLDLDNDVTTGANSHYYEAHYTPVGYLASQGIADQGKIGADSYVEWGCVGYFTPPHTEMGGVNNSGIKEISYSAYDVSEVVSETDAGADYAIYETGITDPDSAKAFNHDGLLPSMGSDDATLVDDRVYFNAHAWGNDFLEMGQSISALKEYWRNKKGTDYFKDGDVIGIAVRTETPMDDWGVDLTPRGELIVTTVTNRPSSIQFDGDDSDWQAYPVLIESVDNVDGFFPSEVGAAVSDRVDVKEVKAFINHEEGMLYWFMRLWGGPAWPNVADQRELNGVPINRSRGYYDLLLDLDNNVTTGANSHYYEAHYTPVGYLASQGIANQDKIGADTYVEWGCVGYFTPPHTEMGGVNNSGIKEMGYSALDVSEVVSETDAGADFTIYESGFAGPDSATAFRHVGLLPILSSDDSTLTSDLLYWNAHAWGEDFLEIAHPIAPIQKYWKNKGKDVLQPGDDIGIAVRTETPLDDWGVDLTPRGVLAYTTGIAAERTNSLPKEFILEKNYPNPFNPETTIEFTMPYAADVNVSIYNMLGQKVRTLVDARVSSGRHSVRWNGVSDAGVPLSSGIYFYRLNSGSTVLVKSMLLLK